MQRKKSPPPTPSDISLEDRYRAPALDKGLDILELLSNQSGAMTRGEILEALDRKPSEIYRMLERLVARRYVTRSKEGDRYGLTLKMHMLGQRYPPLKRLLAQAQPLMEAFSTTAEQSCHLGLIERGNVSVVAQAQSPAKLSLSLRLGSVVGLIDTGSGHVALAFQSPERRAELLVEHEPLEGERAISAAELERRYTQIREDGYWQHASQHSAGIVDISVPIKDGHGHTFAALTCPYIARIDGHNSMEINATREALLAVAHQLSLDHSD